MGEADLGGRLAPFGSVGQRAVANSLHALECARKHGPRGELLHSSGERAMIFGELILFGPCISAEIVKACVLIGLHMMAEENAFRDMWRYGRPKKPCVEQQRL